MKGEEETEGIGGEGVDPMRVRRKKRGRSGK